MTQSKIQKKTVRIFLSYAAADRSYAQQLRNILSQHPNVQIFTTEMLNAGEDWESVLKEELSNCDKFLVVLSPTSVDSKWVLHELGAAWAIGKPIIPIVTNKEVTFKIPVSISHLQIIEIKDIKKPGFVNMVLKNSKKLATLHG